MANSTEYYIANNLMISKSHIKLLRDQKLGKAYGNIFKAKYRGSLCAAKEIQSILTEASTSERNELQDDFIRECYLWSTLNHQNIVRFIGIYYPPQQSPVMIMELMDENLTTYAEKQGISFKIKFSILHDVAEGLSYLHSRNPPIIHCNLSPNDVLLKQLPQSVVAKVSGLGGAQVLNADDRKSLPKLPGILMPPEAFLDEPRCDTSLDVFSYSGIILYTVNGAWPIPTAPFKVDPATHEVRGVNEVERHQKHLDKMTGEAEVLRPLVEVCLDNDPVKRPSIAELSERILALKVCS